MWIQKIKCKEEKIRDSNHVEDNLELMLDWMLWSCSSYLTPGHEGGDQVRSSWDNWSCSSPDVFHLQAAALSHCGRVRPAPGPTWWRRPLSSRGGRQLRRRAQAEVQGEVETPSALCTEVTVTSTTAWPRHGPLTLQGEEAQGVRQLRHLWVLRPGTGDGQEDELLQEPGDGQERSHLLQEIQGQPGQS